MGFVSPRGKVHLHVGCQYHTILSDCFVPQLSSDNNYPSGRYNSMFLSQPVTKYIEDLSSFGLDDMTSFTSCGR